MLGPSPDYLKPAHVCAYYTGVRKEEMLGLARERVDLSGGLIGLKRVGTSTGALCSIPNGRELREVFQPWLLASDA